MQAGTKRATAGLVPTSRTRTSRCPGSAGTGSSATAPDNPRAILRTTELRLGPLASVDDAFAWDEGENDRTRASWLAGYLAYFTRTQQARGEAWSDELEVVFERFRVVWPPEVAD